MTNKSPSFTSLEDELACYKAENKKLKKINEALIYRIEEGGGKQNVAYSVFENSVHLSHQVNIKTHELNIALKDLQVVNKELVRASNLATQSKQLFSDAIESINQAFVLLDNKGNILLLNSRFEKFWHEFNFYPKPGDHYYELKSLAKRKGIILSLTPSKNNQSIYHLNNNRWFQLTERPTSDGGSVLLFTDITDLKLAESARYERAIAKQNRLLQGLIDNLNQGVLLVDSYGDIQVWNKEFLALSELDKQSKRKLSTITNIKDAAEYTELMIDDIPLDNEFQQILSSDKVIQIEHHRLNNGQTIKTFVDITSQYNYAQSLRESETWLRTITDNVPAMIAYINKDKEFTFTNKAYNRWYNPQNINLLGQDLQASKLFNNYELLEQYVNKALNGELVSFDSEEINQNGEKAYLLKTYVPNLNHQQAVDGFFVLVTDITERINAATALQNAYDDLEIRIQQRTVELQQEINIREHAQSNLSIAKREAEKANESKTKFLAAVSHNLMQPLNAAQLFASSFTSQISIEQKNILVQSIQNSLNDLENLIVTLIDISKLDAGVIQPDNEVFQLDSLFNNITNDYKKISEVQNISFSYTPVSVNVYSDSLLLARILRNYLSNAIKHSQATHIRFYAEKHEEMVRIVVSDNGKGIAKNNLDEIYQEFKRLSTRSDSHNSLGLGLAIVDKMSKILSHNIGVDSVLGQGADFWVDVPIATDLPETKPVLTMTECSEAQVGKHAWVIDNDPNICFGMATLLEQWGMDVTTATSLGDLKEKVDIGEDHCDVLIIDYHLDDNKNGLDESQEINSVRTSVLPVVMITANFSQELKENTQRKGIRLLNKPLKPLRLKMILQNL